MISLSIPVLSGYLVYCDLADDDLSSPDLAFENPDVDDIFLLPDSQNHLKLFGLLEPNGFLHALFPETNFFEQLSLNSSHSSSFDQETLVLRC